MVRMDRVMRRTKWVVVAAVCVVLGPGCGLIADPDRRKVAKIDDRYITRADLYDVIRKLPDDERPLIQTKGDLLAALEAYISRELKTQEAERLLAEGKIHIPREQAVLFYDRMHPEQLMKVANPEEYSLTEHDLRFARDQREIGIDRELKRLEGERAILYLVEEGVTTGLLEVTDEEYAREYELRQFELTHPERSTVRGIYFPVDLEDAGALVTEARSRLAAGEELEAVIAAYADKGGVVLETRIVDDRQTERKFASFWEKAHGAEAGSVVGPVYIRGWEKLEQDIRGTMQKHQLPDAFFVCKVLDHTPKTPKSLEEAKIDLQVTILYAKVMDRLRDQHGVEIYEENLPDPSVYDDTQSMMRVR
jgi:hypothetical protein